MIEKPPSLPLSEDFEHFFEESLCGFLTLTPDGKIVRANVRLAGWLAYAPEELIGKRFSDLLSVGSKIYFETHLSPLLRMQGFFDEVATELACKDSGRVQVLLNAMEVRSEGAPQFIRVTVYKATDRRTYEKNLLEAKVSAESNLLLERDSSALREQFIAVLGHDLRNPLSAIISGTAILESAQLSERDRKVVAIMKSSGGRMVELIENVMDFARARLGGGMSVRIEPTTLMPMLQHVAHELQSANSSSPIEVDLSWEEPIDCDGARISQLLSNLLANAITHGAAQKPIFVRGEVGEGGFELSVSNSGKPIPSEAMERLFQPFTREDVRPSQNGLGLGLYIASEIARAHKGTLGATSDENETRFTFQMPME